MGSYLGGSVISDRLLPRGQPRNIVVLTIVFLKLDRRNILRQILVSRASTSFLAGRVNGLVPKNLEKARRNKMMQENDNVIA